MRTDERLRPCAGCRKSVHAVESDEPCPPPHGGVWRCPECNQHMGFVAKPVVDGAKKKRETSQRDLLAKHSKGFCELCLLTRDELLAAGKYLEAHHVKQYADGGTSERENLWIVCNACHKLIGFVRTYHGRKDVSDATG